MAQVVAHLVWDQRVAGSSPVYSTKRSGLDRFAFYGLRRSGNHAILEWLIQNMGGSGERKVVFWRRLMAVKLAAYINEANTYPSLEVLQEHHRIANTIFEKLIVSYEDVNLDYVLPVTTGYKNIVIIRDIPNLFASRYKKSIGYEQPWDFGAMRIDEHSVDIWKNHALTGLNGDAILIQFEKWLDSKEYRDKIAALFGCDNYDITDTITEFGEGSSFSGQNVPTAEDLKNRSNQIELPEEVQQRIEQEDIIELRKRLGYIS